MKVSDLQGVRTPLDESVARSEATRAAKDSRKVSSSHTFWDSEKRTQLRDAKHVFCSESRVSALSDSEPPLDHQTLSKT
jgi:hypothetical protein